MPREIARHQETKPRVESDLSGWKDRSSTDRAAAAKPHGARCPRRNAPVSFCLVRIHSEGTRRLAANVLDRHGWHLRAVSTLIRRTAVTIPWHLALINTIGPHALACTRLRDGRGKKRGRGERKKGSASLFWRFIEWLSRTSHGQFLLSPYQRSLPKLRLHISLEEYRENDDGDREEGGSIIDAASRGPRMEF